MFAFPRSSRTSGPFHRFTSASAVCIFGLAAASAAIGCGSNFVATAPASTPAGGSVASNGRVYGGQQPVTNANITVFQVGTSGNGSAATNIMKQTVLTDVNGGFSLTGTYTCSPSNALVYVVATQGNPGLKAGTNNAALTLMAVAGPCSNFGPSTYLNINEVTTVAAAWALAPFMKDYAHVGSSASNGAGLANAMTNALLIADMSTGVSPGSTLPANATLQTAKVYALANIIATCVNSDGTAACSTLFSNAAVSTAPYPVDSLTAALSIVQHPGHNVSNLFSLPTATAPFGISPTPPSDWTLSIAYTGGGMNLPTADGVDSNGNVWVASYYNTLSGFSPQGVPLAANGYSGSGLYESYSLTIDPSNNIWVANQEGSPSGGGSISKFSNAGVALSNGSGFYPPSVFFPVSVASDSTGNIWVADYGHSTASLLQPNGNDLSGNGFGSTVLEFPDAVAIDKNNNAWIANQESPGTAVLLSPTGATLANVSCCMGPAAIAVDSNNTAWVGDYAGNVLVAVNQASGVVATGTGGGIARPQGVAIDGANNVWLTNYRGNTISEFANSGTPLSTMTNAAGTVTGGGFGSDAGLVLPFGLAIDASGDLWVVSSFTNTLVNFIGVASPIKTPLVGPPAQP